MKLNKIFNVITQPSKSKDLTEFEIYSLIEEKNINYIPVISSKTENEGIFGYIPMPEINICDFSNNKMIVQNNINYFINKQGCITVTKDGYSGVMMYRSPEKYPIFSITSHSIILSPIIEKINLQWFSYRYQSLFLSHNTEGENNHFGKSVWIKYDFDLPSEFKINLELNLFNKLINKKKQQLEKINLLNSFLKKQITSFSGNSFFLNEVFGYGSRNDELSEETIYQRILDSNRTVNVISGSGKNFYGKIREDENLNYVKDKPILCLITCGDAGKVFPYKKGSYASSQNAYPLYLKDDFKNKIGLSESEEEIYLDGLSIVLEPKFISVSSEGGSLSVFPVKESFKSKPLKIYIPNKELVIELGCIYRKINNKINKIEQDVKKIEILMSKEFIYTS